MIRPLLLLSCATALWPACAQASLDSAEIKTPYFSASVGFSGGYDEYARHWAGWLKLYRAIEASPRLSHQMPQQRKLGAQPNPAHGGYSESGAFERLKRRVPARLLNSQPTNVFVLQLKTFGSAAQTARWVRTAWPKIGAKAIYASTPKRCYFWAATQYDLKAEPLFVLPAPSARSPLLCYGMYASQADARADAARLDAILGTRSRILSRPLSASLARAFRFDDFAGDVVAQGGSDKILGSWDW